MESHLRLMPTPYDSEDFEDEDILEGSIEYVQGLDFNTLPEGKTITVFETGLAESCFSREGDKIVVEITDHNYIKFWFHKFSAHTFAEAMLRAIKRLAVEGHPLSEGTMENEDGPHIYLRWKLTLPIGTPGPELIESTNAALDLVWARANAILEDSDSVLILGKDTDESMDLLHRIRAVLEDLGYFVFIIKELPDKLGEEVMQKVLRYALSSKFVVIENTEASGHLYEIPYVAKMASCVSLILQEESKGATWMFEDLYAKLRSIKKVTYEPDALEDAVKAVANWAEEFVKEFGRYQQAHLPWMK
jgi:hypothetical protein